MEEQNFFELPWHVYIILIVIGAGVGFVGGFAGIGGAPFMVALLKLFVQFCQHRAQGTVLAVMLPPMALLGVLSMKKRAMVMIRYSFIGFVSYAVMSYAGALLAFLFDSKALSVMFGAFLIVLSGYYAIQHVRTQNAAKAAGVEPKHDDDALNDIGLAAPRDDDEFDPNKPYDPEASSAALATPAATAATSADTQASEMNPDGPTVKPGARFQFNYWSMMFVGVIVGTIGGMFGIGAGVLMVPVFTELFGLHKNDARVLSLSILLPPVSAGAIIKYQEQGSVDWWMAAFLFILYFFSNPMGAKVGRDISTVKFKMFMGALLGVLGAVIILFAVVANPIDPKAEERCNNAV